MNSCSYWKLAFVNTTQGKLVNINHNSAKAEGFFLYTTLSNRIHYFPCCNKVQHMVMKAKGYDLSTSESPEKKQTGLITVRWLTKSWVCVFMCVGCSLVYLNSLAYKAERMKYRVIVKNTATDSFCLSINLKLKI